MISIRLATIEESLNILNKSYVANRTGQIAKGLSIQPWLAYNGNGAMMFVFWPSDSSGEYELHVAANKESIRESRILGEAIIKFMFDHGCTSIITNCPEGKIANFARKLGFKDYANKGNIYLRYGVTEWELKQQL